MSGDTPKVIDDAVEVKPESKVSSESHSKIICGLIRPISSMGSDYPTSHWEDVKNIVERAVRKAGFEPRTVSDSKEATIIHSSIVQNIYDDAIVVCDVSNKNPNVMFELGMRLAFDKPVVVIKDDKTDYSFDTSPLEHLTYPRDLRHGQVDRFILHLTEKIKSTHAASLKESPKTFLSHFGQFEVKGLDHQTLSIDSALQKILQKIGRLEEDIDNFGGENPNLITKSKHDFEKANTISIPRSIYMTSENGNEVNMNMLKLKIKDVLADFKLSLCSVTVDDYSIIIDYWGVLSPWDSEKLVETLNYSVDMLFNIRRSFFG